MLIITAYQERSLIFFVKQILTFLPVVIIIGQIIYHKRDHWHEEGEIYCINCKKEMELDWGRCPYCKKLI